MDLDSTSAPQCNPHADVHANVERDLSRSRKPSGAGVQQWPYNCATVAFHTDCIASDAYRSVLALSISTRTFSKQIVGGVVRLVARHTMS